MAFDRDRLPDPASYYEAQGLHLKGPARAKWKTTACQFHGGSDSMRINTETGGFCCMACDAKIGGVIQWHIFSKPRPAKPYPASPASPALEVATAPRPAGLSAAAGHEGHAGHGLSSAAPEKGMPCSSDDWQSDDIEVEIGARRASSAKPKPTG